MIVLVSMTTNVITTNVVKTTYANERRHLTVN